MAFLNPLYLWALLGLAVPVAIHFWSKKEGRTIKVGSIKFLKESDPKQASSIRLNEIWLLILRMLALAILVLILAEPVLKSKDSRATLTYLVEPSLLQHEEMSRIMDTINPGVEVRLLTPDFPEYSADENYVAHEIPDYWQLTRNMNELNSDSIVVFTAGYASGFKGRRPVTDQNINWIQVIPDEIVNKPILAIAKGDDVEIISVSGDHNRLGIEKEVTSIANIRANTAASGDSILITHNGRERSIPLRITDTLKVSLYNDEDLEEQMRYLRSSLRAIAGYINTPVQISDLSQGDAINDKEDLLVWLSTSPVKETDSSILIWKPDSLSTTLIELGIKTNVHYLTRPLNSENIVEEHLPEQLFHLLGINEGLEEKIAKYDRRVMPLDEILPVSGSIGGKIEVSSALDIRKYFWVLLVILLIAERGLSAYRKQ